MLRIKEHILTLIISLIIGALGVYVTVEKTQLEIFYINKEIINLREKQEEILKQLQYNTSKMDIQEANQVRLSNSLDQLTQINRELGDAVTVLTVELQHLKDRETK